MNEFDKQRIENAIWTLLQYEYDDEFKQIIKDIDEWNYEKFLWFLNKIKEQLSK